MCELLIFDFLDSNLKDYLVISEETETNLSRLEEVEYVITVDPIDGTENFVSGLKEWGVGISVYKGMRHYQSMIMLPELGIRLCTGDQFSKIIGSRICGLSSYMQPEDFKRLEQGSEYRIMGCCMYNMYFEAVCECFYFCLDVFVGIFFRVCMWLWYLDWMWNWKGKNMVGSFYTPVLNTALT